MRFYVGVSMFLFSVPLAAQSARSGPTDRGSMLIAGSGNLSRVDGDGSSATSIDFQPSIHYFVANRIAVGGELGLSYTDFENGSATSWRVGPATRVYFGSAAAKTLPYIGAAVQFGAGSARSGSNETDASLWGIQGIAGLTFMLSRNVGIAGEAFVEREEGTFETSLSKVTTTAMRYGLRFGVAAFVF